MKSGSPFGRLRAGSTGDFGPAHHERGGGGWEVLVRLGCQGWRGCAELVGCCWVPAGDAGMAEGRKTGGSETPLLRKITRNGWESRLKGRDRVAGGQGGRVGVAGCAGLAWLLLGPGRGRRDDVVGVG